MNNDNILYEIFLHLSVEDIDKLCKINKEYSKICTKIKNDKQFWVTKFRNDFQNDPITNDVQKEYYMIKKLDNLILNTRGKIYIEENYDVRTMLYLPERIVNFLDIGNINFNNPPVIYFDILSPTDIGLAMNYMLNNYKKFVTIEEISVDNMKNLLIFLKEKYGKVTLIKDKKKLIDL